MNYIKELNAFRNWLLLHKLSSGSILLWHTLMSINNMAGWEVEFNASNTVIYQLTGLTKNKLITARRQLQEHDLIIYHKGNKGKAPVYQMVSVHEKMNQMMGRSQDQSEEQYLAPNANLFEAKNKYQFWIQSGTEKQNKPKHKPKQKQISSSGSHVTENQFEDYRKNIGILRPAARDVIITWCRELGDEIMIAGMKLAVKKGGVTLSYIEEILKEWASAGLKTLDEVSAYEKQKAEKKRNFQVEAGCF